MDAESYSFAKGLSVLKFEPTIELFASGLNRKFRAVCAYMSDPDASTLMFFYLLVWS